MSDNSGSPLPSFRNTPRDFLTESLSGFVASHPDAVWDHAGFIARRSPLTTDSGSPAVAVVSGGGSGHEPMHAGFLGAGMLAAAVPGLLFTSPNAVQVTEATRWADRASGGAGVVHIVKNYTGDIINFRVARQGLPDVPTREVVVADDVATGTGGPGRRGTGATVLVEKVAGAAARRGFDLDEVTRLAQLTADSSRSMAVALAPGHLPTTGRPTFDLDDGEVEIGVGIHGEPGVDRAPLPAAADLVDRMVGAVVADLDLSSGDRVFCMVNGLGGTSRLEMDLVFNDVLRRLTDHGVHVSRSLVGAFVTSVTMAGVSVTVTALPPEDADLLTDLLDAPTNAPAWPRVLGTDPRPVRATVTVDDDVPGDSDDAENLWLSAFVRGVVTSVDDLTELDRLAGDGDFGTNMDAAFGDLPPALRGSDADVLHALSHRLFVRAGGTSGAVFGTLLRELAATAASGPDATLTPDGLADALENALTAITELGGAAPGDRTMVDALAPAARAARDAVPTGDPEAVGRAAWDGAVGTADMVASKGRASYLGDRARGVVDPGALVVAWLFGDAGRMPDGTGD